MFVLGQGQEEEEAGSFAILHFPNPETLKEGCSFNDSTPYLGPKPPRGSVEGFSRPVTVLRQKDELGVHFPKSRVYSFHHLLKGICNPPKKKKVNKSLHLVQNPDFTGTDYEAGYGLNCRQQNNVLRSSHCGSAGYQPDWDP